MNNNKINKVEDIIEKEEKETKGRGKKASITILNCLLFELKNDVSNSDIIKYKNHINEIEKFMSYIKEKGWEIPKDIINEYQNLKNILKINKNLYKDLI